MARLKDLYLEGDIGREDYRRQRRQLQEELEALPVASYETTGEERLREIGRYLSNLGQAWEDAADEDRRSIVAELFSCIYVGNREAVAVVPRPALRAFVVPILDTGTAHRRKRRASDSHLRALLEDDSAVIVPALARHGGEISKGRYGVARSHKLTPNDIACIRMMDGSLRAIAAEFGVSHELVRSIRNA
jgi:hypothetical protein